jgi:ribonuclease BN (tRNA processing enzyme)
MELKFLGRGAAFNPKEGNNAAYFKENNELFLIDCGETIFEKIIEKNILKDINNINILITHTHGDHIGSIGTLIMYCYYNLNIKTNIILCKNAKHKENIENIIKNFGCNNKMYNYIEETTYDNKYKTFKTIRYKETTHCKELNCYGIEFETENGIIYYSGDTNDITYIKELIKKDIDKIYIDTTSKDYKENVHLYIGKIKEIIPEKLNKKIYCMHLNDDECIKLVKEYGYNIVELTR